MRVLHGSLRRETFLLAKFRGLFLLLWVYSQSGTFGVIAPAHPADLNIVASMFTPCFAHLHTVFLSVTIPRWMVMCDAASS